MTIYKKPFSKILIIMLLSISLSACFGPRLNKKNLNDEINPQLIIVQSSDKNIEIALNKLLFRNHPSSWSKDAKWDEYIFTINNLADTPITIDNIYIFDALNERHAPKTSRIQLLGATRATKKRHRKAGNKITIGAGSTQALMGALAASAVGVSLGAGIAGATAVTTSAGTLTVAGGAVVAAVPIVAIGGITKLVNNKKVSNQIEKRQTAIPTIVNANQQKPIDLFYSVVPGPKRIELIYKIGENTHTLNIDLNEELSQLHINNLKK